MESLVAMEQGDHPCCTKAVLVDVSVVPNATFVSCEGLQPRAVAVLLNGLPKQLGIVGAVYVVTAS